MRFCDPLKRAFLKPPHFEIVDPPPGRHPPPFSIFHFRPGLGGLWADLPHFFIFGPKAPKSGRFCRAPGFFDHFLEAPATGPCILDAEQVPFSHFQLNTFSFWHVHGIWADIQAIFARLLDFWTHARPSSWICWYLEANLPLFQGGFYRPLFWRAPAGVVFDFSTEHFFILAFT